MVQWKLRAFAGTFSCLGLASLADVDADWGLGGVLVPLSKAAILLPSTTVALTLTLYFRPKI